MKRLLVINSSASTGSTGSIASSIATAAAADGWNTLLAHSARFAPNSAPTFDTYTIGSRADAAVHAIGSRLFDSHGMHSREATSRLIKEIERFAPDVINLHNLHGYYLHYPLLFAFLRGAGIPVVWTMHDLWAVTGHCAFPDVHGCHRWHQSCGHCPGLRSYPASILADHSERNLMRKREAFSGIPGLTVVAVSGWMARELKHSHMKDYPIRMIRNGVDLSVFKPYEREANARPRVLAVASRWTARKGLTQLFQLADALGDRCHIIAAAMSPSQAREAAAHGITPMPRMDRQEDLARMYASADVFVSTALGDNLPTTLMEALACGTPAVGFTTGGTAEIISEGCGHVCTPGDVEELARAVMAVAMRGREKYSDACRLKAEADFGKDHALRQYLSLFHSLT